MKTVGIISEYNPFHNGHEYQIKKAKEITGADFVIIIMSGNFTQQGNIAITNKFSRAQMAIHAGADLVLELPTIFATSNAETFAFGAINILDKLNIIDYLVFGTECNDILVLENIVTKLTNYKETIDNKINDIIKDGICYTSAKDIALKSILDLKEYEEISKPNNILAIEYLKALKTLNSNIKPIAIKRESASHNDYIVNTLSNFSSATSIRNSIKINGLESIKSFVPKSTYDILNNLNITSNENMFKLLRYKIMSLGKSKLKKIYDISEGLENKIYDSIIVASSYEDILKSVKSKRYTLSRIKRILIHILLDIYKEDYIKLQNTFYARILKINSNNKNILLKKINKESFIPVITNINNQSFGTLPDDIILSLALDFNANNVYQILANDNLNTDKTNML